MDSFKPLFNGDRMWIVESMNQMLTLTEKQGVKEFHFCVIFKNKKVFIRKRFWWDESPIGLSEEEEGLVNNIISERSMRGICDSD